MDHTTAYIQSCMYVYESDPGAAKCDPRRPMTWSGRRAERLGRTCAAAGPGACPDGPPRDVARVDGAWWRPRRPWRPTASPRRLVVRKRRKRQGVHVLIYRTLACPRLGQHPRPAAAGQGHPVRGSRRARGHARDAARSAASETRVKTRERGRGRRSRVFHEFTKVVMHQIVVRTPVKR